MLAVKADAAPNPADFDEVTTDLAAQPRLTGIVVRPRGSTPGARQRASMQELLSKRALRMAVLTDSKLVRGAATALRWFGVPVECYPDAKLDEALTFAGIPADRLDLARQHFQELITYVEPARRVGTQSY
ncbi:MAG TPA: STAS/SEC14 domain-containing protein [Polyangiales bacterium]|nr:STAS/SEC14 domain-containing protein [Polyangiales bacterium]